MHCDGLGRLATASERIRLVIETLESLRVVCTYVHPERIIPHIWFWDSVRHSAERCPNVVNDE